MDWSKGFSAQYYASIVDARSWRDVDRIEITEGSVEHSENGLRCSATVTCKDYAEDVEQWIRIYLIASQKDNSELVPLFTGLATSPEGQHDGLDRTNALECYSVLKPAEDVLLPRGWYAAAGICGTDLIRDLLSVTPAPVEADENAPVLQSAIVAEDHESRLSMCDKILTAIGWRIRISGDGTIRLCPAARDVIATFNADDNDVIEPKISVSQDWFSCPNVFRAISGDMSGIARDDSEDSMLSTVSRGREVWTEESGCSLNEGETIADYALRRLREAQEAAQSAKYSRRFLPDLVATDLVRMNYPAQGLIGVYKVASQSMVLGYGGRTTEEVKKV